MTDLQKKSVISKETLLPMSLVLLLCTGVVWINSTLLEINYKLDTIEEKLEDKFTRSEMDKWILRFQLENPEISIPEVSD